MQGVNTSPRIFLFVHFLHARQGSGTVLVTEFSAADTLHSFRPKHHYSQYVKDLRQPTSAIAFTYGVVACDKIT